MNAANQFRSVDFSTALMLEKQKEIVFRKKFLTIIVDVYGHRSIRWQFIRARKNSDAFMTEHFV